MPRVRRAERAEARPQHWIPRPRVLIECADYGVAFAAERVLDRRGYDVSVCGGPDHLRGRRCPLVTQGSCDLVDHADVVVHCLNPDHEELRAVLAALRSRRPGLPVVAEVTALNAAEHAELLDGCTLMPFPITSTQLRAAVRSAMPFAD